MLKEAAKINETLLAAANENERRKKRIAMENVKIHNVFTRSSKLHVHTYLTIPYSSSDFVARAPITARRRRETKTPRKTGTPKTGSWTLACLFVQSNACQKRMRVYTHSHKHIF